jgi:beta-N-acetylhexosaminidase
LARSSWRFENYLPESGVGQLLRILLGLIRLSVAVVLVWLAFTWRTPLLASIREAVFIGLIAISLALIVAELLTLRSSPRSTSIRRLSLLALLTATFALLSTLAIETRFQWMRYVVLNADTAELEPLGRHFIVGYRSDKELRRLIENKAIGGVFLSARNVAERSVSEIGQKIGSWQQMRREQNLPPLWISTDQEGGPVSRMSPPLPRQRALAAVVAEQTDDATRIRAARDYANTQGQALHALGVNLNLAPVVDINHNVIKANDRYSQIYRRAISEDPQIVAHAAGAYCAGLSDNGINCVLKHFPGLGRVVNDTHLETADLDTAVASLNETDWVPFRALMNDPNRFIMLAHVRLTALDRERPASFSPAVVENLLRKEWGFQGVLLTDDATMGAFYGSPWGITGGALQALNAGVDLILISYDTDQYFVVMHALLQAARKGTLDQNRQRESEKRLNAAKRE